MHIPSKLAAAITALVLSATAWAATPQKETAAGRVQVEPEVVVHASSITLADLLPANAPEALRKQASTVALGAAPQPPGVRMIYRQQLQYLLAGNKMLLAQLTIPPEMRVQRFHRMISRQEVIAAISQALGGTAKGGAATALRGLDLASIQLPAPVYVTSADPGLRVIRIESDPDRRETRFRLWTANEPANLPFTVSAAGAVKLPVLVATRGLMPGEIVSPADFSVEMRPGAGLPAKPLAMAAGLSGLEARAVVRPGEAVSRDDFGRAVLVRPETLATLIVEGPGFRIKTQVTPLEQGVLNQEIRVRNTESRQVLEARVIGRDRLMKTQ